jgi:hypothetical protein
VADRIAAAPDGPVTVLHVANDLVHLDLPGGAVGVAASAAPGLPHALRTNLPTVASLGSSGEPPTAYVGSGILHLGGRALVTGRLVDVRAPRLDPARIPMTSPAVDQGTPRSRGAGLVAALGRAQVATDVRIDAEVVSELVGRGDGLTPLGDDVLCGWLAAHRAVGVATPDVDDAVRRALPRTTTLSATLLECALAGEAADHAAAYQRVVGTAGAPAARAALTRLGHSSGAGLAHGIDLAIAALATREAA